MSSPTPRPLPTAESDQQADPIEDSSRAGGSSPRSLARKLNLRFAALIRWIHIYLSMISLAAILFFSVTGVTLNHPSWFFGETDAVSRRRAR